MDYLFLDVKKLSPTSRRFFYGYFSAAKKAGLNVGLSSHYAKCKVLVIYGLGGADRYKIAMHHIKHGGTVISFDIGYWDRDLPNRKYRFSINGLHPTQVMQTTKPDSKRLYEANKPITQTEHRSADPIMLVGNAPKSIAVGADGWTREASKQIRKHFPKNEVVYRPKPSRPKEPGVIFDRISTEPIEHALKNISLVVCRHSNVAVDACFMGVPVVASDGAASSIYPNTLADYRSQPSAELRRDFLERLAYWQWSASEAVMFWGWFLKTFKQYDYR